MPAAASAPADDALCQSGALTADDGPVGPGALFLLEVVRLRFRHRIDDCFRLHRPPIKIESIPLNSRCRRIRNSGPYSAYPSASSHPMAIPVAQAICPANDRSAAQHRRYGRPRPLGLVE